ncbi:zinc finger protein 320-like [Armigeres subalbatus]|uniref:zinc finger protein 320-like n=1 Tax=Armigeres subalbatus TaxID=124917 RepID=UPI002ED17C0C
MYVCRVCLGQNRPLYVPLFAVHGKRSVAETIMICTGLKLKRNDGFTQFVCSLCVDEFSKFYELRELCLNSDAFLRSSNCNLVNESEAIKNDSVPDADASKDDQIDCLDEFVKSTIVIEEIEITESNEGSRIITEEWVVEMDDGKANQETTEVYEILDDPICANSEDQILPTKPLKSAEPSKKKQVRRKKKSKSPIADDTKFVCCSCPSEVFDSQQRLDAHRADQHEKLRIKSSTIRPYECNVCYQRFVDEKHLTLHKNRSNRSRSFVCTSCGRAFLASSTLKKHEQICAPTTVCNYECSECGKHFLQSGSLRNHMKLHTSDKTHSCPICGKTFMKRFEVPIHLVTHTTEQPFACDKCPAKFKRMQALRSHQRHHSNPTPYKCDQCDEWFNSFSARKYHRQKLHEGIEPFRCEICEISYGRQSRLTNHIRKMHAGATGSINKSE